MENLGAPRGRGERSREGRTLVSRFLLVRALHLVALRLGREVTPVPRVVLLLAHRRRLVAARDAKIEIDSEINSHAVALMFQ